MQSTSGHGSVSRTSSTPATTSLRPRAPRLISGLDEGDEVDFDPTNSPARRIASPIPSPYNSRSVSPIPKTHPSRSATTFNHRKHNPSVDNGRGSSLRKTENSSSVSLAGLWGTSWTAIQGIASDLLAGEETHEATQRAPRRRKGSKSGSGRPATSAPPRAWGPTSAPRVVSTTSYIATGSKEERDALVRAQKRKELLSGASTEYADSLGRFKRRTSDAGGSASAPPQSNEERDALVYVHHVTSNDTLAGITIKYNCSAQVLRKANRMWPNDSIQVKKTLLLPVDGCGAKGRPVSPPENVDLLSQLEMDNSKDSTPTNGRSGGNKTIGRARNESISTNSDRPLPSVASSTTESEPPWIHDSWVMLPNGTRPTEIARLSRKALGYFPPARRKSQSYSDFDTPSTSLDIARPAFVDPNSMSPIRQEAQQKRPAARRMSSASNGYFPSYLAGPGGVGTMNKNVRCPGPGQDGLNKMFANRLPNVAPPANQHHLYMPDIPAYSDEVSGASTPLASGTQTPNLNLENVGATVEGWFRKMASKAQTAIDPAERQGPARLSVGASGRGAGGIGDLIEMADTFEIGGDEDEEEEEEEQAARGRQGSSTGEVGTGRAAQSSVSFGHDQLQRRGRSGTSSAAIKRVKDD